MALSFYDQLLMSSADQQKINQISDMWNASTSQSEKDSLHAMAEAIRNKYGYSGDTTSNYASGGGFTQTGLPIPQLGEWSSPYADRIDSALSKIENYGEFEYDPEADESYQAFMTNVNKAARQTFNDTIAGTSVGTGGRPNSWASTVAAQAQGNMMLEGQSKMVDFENIAYNQWNDTRNFSIQQLEALMGLDQTAYGQFMDQYNAEVDVYNAALQAKQQRIDDAMQRTEMTGFVSNADSVILGVPAGTLSSAARDRAWALEDYLTQAQIDKRYAKSSGGGGGDDSEDDKWKYTQVQNTMKQAFKYKDGQYGGTPEARGEKLMELYNGGFFGYDSLISYAAEFDAVLPEQAEQSKGSVPTDANVQTIIRNIQKGQSMGGGSAVTQYIEQAIKDYGEAAVKQALDYLGIDY